MKLPAADRVLWIGQHLLGRLGIADPPSPIVATPSGTAGSEGGAHNAETQEAMQDLVPVLQAAVNAARARPHSPVRHAAEHLLLTARSSASYSSRGSSTCSSSSSSGSSTARSVELSSRSSCHHELNSPKGEVLEDEEEEKEDGRKEDSSSELPPPAAADAQLNAAASCLSSSKAAGDAVAAAATPAVTEAVATTAVSPQQQHSTQPLSPQKATLGSRLDAVCCELKTKRSEPPAPLEAEHPSPDESHSCSLQQSSAQQPPTHPLQLPPTQPLQQPPAPPPRPKQDQLQLPVSLEPQPSLNAVMAALDASAGADSFEERYMRTAALRRILLPAHNALGGLSSSSSSSASSSSGSSGGGGGMPSDTRDQKNNHNIDHGGSDGSTDGKEWEASDPDVVLLSGFWLIDHIRSKGEALPPRHLLPTEAIASPPTVEALCDELDELAEQDSDEEMCFPPLLVVSSAYDLCHEDVALQRAMERSDGLRSKRGVTLLTTLARALEWYCAERCCRRGERRDVAVFMPCSSLHRPTGAAEAYARGLGHVDALMAHRGTVMLMLPASCSDTATACGSDGSSSAELASIAIKAANEDNASIASQPPLSRVAAAATAATARLAKWRDAKALKAGGALAPERAANEPSAPFPRSAAWLAYERIVGGVIAPRKHVLHLAHFASAAAADDLAAADASTKDVARIKMGEMSLAQLSEGASYVHDMQPGTLGLLIGNNRGGAPPRSMTGFERCIEAAEGVSADGAEAVIYGDGCSAASDTPIPSPYLIHLLAVNNEKALKRSSLADAAAACVAVGGEAEPSLDAPATERAVVHALYEAVMRRLMAGARHLGFTQRGWNDTHVEAIAEALVMCEDGPLDLDLSWNSDISSRSVRSLVQRSPLRAILSLHVEGCKAMGDDGARALAAAVGAMVQLEQLHLSETGMTDGGFGALVSKGICAGKLPHLRSLLANRNRIGDDSAAALSLAARAGKLPHLRTLGLGSALTGQGVQSLIEAAASLPALGELLLADNSALGTAEADALHTATTAASGGFLTLEVIELTDWGSIASGLVCQLGGPAREKPARLPLEALALLQRMCARAAPSDPAWREHFGPLLDAALTTMKVASDWEARAACCGCFLALLRRQPWRLASAASALVVELVICIAASEDEQPRLTDVGEVEEPASAAGHREEAVSNVRAGDAVTMQSCASEAREALAILLRSHAHQLRCLGALVALAIANDSPLSHRLLALRLLSAVVSGHPKSHLLTLLPDLAAPLAMASSTAWHASVRTASVECLRSVQRVMGRESLMNVIKRCGVTPQGAEDLEVTLGQQDSDATSGSTMETAKEASPGCESTESPREDVGSSADGSMLELEVAEANGYVSDRLTLAARCAEDEAQVAREAHSLRMLFEEDSAEEEEEEEEEEYTDLEEEEEEQEEAHSAAHLAATDAKQEGGGGESAEDEGGNSSGRGEGVDEARQADAQQTRQAARQPVWWQQRRLEPVTSLAGAAPPSSMAELAADAPGRAGLSEALEHVACYSAMRAVSDHCLGLVAASLGAPTGEDSLTTKQAAGSSAAAAAVEHELAESMLIDRLEAARAEAARRLMEHSGLLSLSMDLLRHDVAAFLEEAPAHIGVASRASQDSDGDAAMGGEGNGPSRGRHDGGTAGLADFLATKRALERVWVRVKALSDDALVNSRMRRALGRTLAKLAAVAQRQLERARGEAARADAALAREAAAADEAVQKAFAHDPEALEHASHAADDAHREVGELELLLLVTARQRASCDRAPSLTHACHAALSSLAAVLKQVDEAQLTAVTARLDASAAASERPHGASVSSGLMGLHDVLRAELAALEVSFPGGVGGSAEEGSPLVGTGGCGAQASTLQADVDEVSDLNGETAPAAAATAGYELRSTLSGLSQVIHGISLRLTMRVAILERSLERKIAQAVAARTAEKDQEIAALAQESRRRIAELEAELAHERAAAELRETEQAEDIARAEAEAAALHLDNAELRQALERQERLCDGLRAQVEAAELNAKQQQEELLGVDGTLVQVLGKVLAANAVSSDRDGALDGEGDLKELSSAEGLSARAGDRATEVLLSSRGSISEDEYSDDEGHLAWVGTTGSSHRQSSDEEEPSSALILQQEVASPRHDNELEHEDEEGTSLACQGHAIDGQAQDAQHSASDCASAAANADHVVRADHDTVSLADWDE